MLKVMLNVKLHANCFHQKTCHLCVIIENHTVFNILFFYVLVLSFLYIFLLTKQSLFL